MEQSLPDTTIKKGEKTMKMRKILSLALVAVVLLSCFTSCGKAKDDRLEQIKAKGYLEVATEPYFAPYEFIDPSKEGDAQYVGFDIEIAKYIANKIGVELKIVPLDFTAVLASVTEGKYDMAISAIAYSPTREEAMNLSKGYLIADTGYGFVCRTADAAKYTDIASLDGAVVITQSGSVQESIYNMYVKDAVKVKEFKLVAQMTDAYLAVSEGKADVCICSTDSASLYASNNDNVLTVPAFRFDVDPELNGVVVGMPPEGTDSLKKLVNSCIDELIAADKISQWKAEATEYAKTLGVE